MTRVCVLALAFVLWACEREPSCHFGNLEVIAETLPDESGAPAAPYANVAIARLGDQEFYAFTGGAGLELRLWNRADPFHRMLGDRCVSLAAAVVDDTRVSLVCTLVEEPGKDRLGEVVVYDVDISGDVEVRRRATNAPIGSAHVGVGAAVNPVTSELEVVFASGTTGHWDAMHVSMGVFGARRVEDRARVISRGQPVFSSPALLFRDGERLVYFSEFVPDASVEVTGLRGTLMVQRTPAEASPERAPRPVEALRVAATTPIVAGEGALLFQDVRRPHTFPSLFLRSVSDDAEDGARLMRGALTGSLPQAADCGPGITVAMPRRFDGDSLVRVAFLDDAHTAWAPETEVYEYGGHLFAVDLYCDGPDAVLATSARYEVESKSARIYRVPIRCEE